MKNITIYTAEDGFDILRILAEVEETNTSNFEKPRLIVIDSISGCLFVNVLKKSGLSDGGSGTFLVKEVGLTLRRLARENDFAVLVTNGVVSQHFQYNSSIVRPALSGLWRYSDIKLLLRIETDSTIAITSDEKKSLSIRLIRASLLKHFEKPVNLSDNASCACFGIYEGGVMDITP